MRYREFKLNENILNEINMSPSNLEKLTKNIDAKIGIEFEFIMQVDDQDMVDKPDEKATGINSVLYFFTADDDSNSDAIDQLADLIIDEYNEWEETAIETYMNDPDREYNRKEILRSYFYVGKAEEIRKEFKKRITDITGYEEDTPEFRNIYKWHVSMSSGRLDRSNNDSVLNQVNGITNSDEIGLTQYYEIRKPIYDQIDKKVEAYLEGNTIPEKRSLDAHLRSQIKKRAASELQFVEENYPMMSDIYERFEVDNLFWPKQEDSIELDDILDEFTMAVGNNYEIETDSSIQPEGPNDVPVEIKTDGALPLEQALEELRKARDFIFRNGYTNDSTGLHINISVPGFSRTNLDYMKLILLAGDDYLLKQFDREGNTYAQRSLSGISASSVDTEEALSGLQTDLNFAAGQIIHNGWTDKYVSIGVHSNRIEFRSPGGAWVGEQEIDFIVNSIRRMVVAVDAALDDNKYKQEYAKKLYKFLKPYSASQDITKLFSMYKSGIITKNQLTRKTQSLSKNRPKTDDLYWIYGHNYLEYIWGSGKTKSEAFEDSRNEILSYINDKPNKKKAWNEEMRDSKFFPTNRETHEKIQAGETFGIKYDSKNKIYYI